MEHDREKIRHTISRRELLRLLAATSAAVPLATDHCAYDLESLTAAAGISAAAAKTPAWNRHADSP